MLPKITTAVIPMARYQFLHFMSADVFFVANKLTPDYQESISISWLAI
jgi:hypothetical protein